MTVKTQVLLGESHQNEASRNSRYFLKPFFPHFERETLGENSICADRV